MRAPRSVSRLPGHVAAPRAVVSPGLRPWVEELALAFERDGLPRMAGRIFGWLLVCDPAEQTLEELGAALQGSKASMSTMTRLLEQAGLVERIRAPGERRDRYRIREGQWEALWAERLQLLRQMSALLGRGLALLAGAPRPARKRLEEFHEQYRFFEKELPALVLRWQRTTRARPAGRGRRGGQ